MINNTAELHTHMQFYVASIQIQQFQNSFFDRTVNFAHSNCTKGITISLSILSNTSLVSHIHYTTKSLWYAKQKMSSLK